ncbi:MAG: SDR family oxidoreductase [Deltaproteobacteria bacterium]|nr:SDR family oxidoreductase [Deltaproteobacteria bacterium]
MRILILGGDGMLGHQLLRYLVGRHEVRVTLRQGMEVYRCHRLFHVGNSFPGVDVRSFERLTEVVAEFRPDAVVNGVGIVKQRLLAKESLPTLEINALLPHRLAMLCKAAGARLIHLSTDCVFSGKKGNYRENDLSDAEDLYGKSKFLGEVHESHCLTLRTSIIGRELFRKKSLLEWFLAQQGAVRGFKNAIFTGFSTLEMSRIIEMLLVAYPLASGLYQVSSDPLSKFELLSLINRELRRDIEIVPDETFHCDRSLDSFRFRREFGYEPPPWPHMVAEMVKDFSSAGCYSD